MLRTVRAIALENVAPFELGVVCEVFGIDRRDTGGPTFDFAVCTPRPGLVSTKIGISIDVPLGLEAAEGADLVVVPAYGDDRAIDDDVIALLRDAHARGAWILSVCSGSFALGHAGLLDGRGCTTHWMYTEQLQEMFPRARVDPDVLYVEDDRVVTSAGTAAGIDACLHLVRRELGAGPAAAIARRMVVPPHRDGGQAQYIAAPVACDPQALSGVLAWAAEHVDADLSVPALAARAVMSERSFARRFRAETGTTPAAWVVRLRLARAQEMLETTTAGVDEIARTCGFGTAAVMRHHFARSLGTSPLAYRRRFAGELAS